MCSQGDTVEQAQATLQEALELFSETAPPDEVSRQIPDDVYVTQSQVPDHAALRRGTLRAIIRQSGIDKAEFESK